MQVLPKSTDQTRSEAMRQAASVALKIKITKGELEVLEAMGREQIKSNGGDFGIVSDVERPGSEKSYNSYVGHLETKGLVHISRDPDHLDQFTLSQAAWFIYLEYTGEMVQGWMIDDGVHITPHRPDVVTDEIRITSGARGGVAWASVFPVTGGIRIDKVRYWYPLGDEERAEDERRLAVRALAEKVLRLAKPDPEAKRQVVTRAAFLRNPHTGERFSIDVSDGKGGSAATPVLFIHQNTPNPNARDALLRDYNWLGDPNHHPRVSDCLAPMDKSRGVTDIPRHPNDWIRGMREELLHMIDLGMGHNCGFRAGPDRMGFAEGLLELVEISRVDAVTDEQNPLAGGYTWHDITAMGQATSWFEDATGKVVAIGGSAYPKEQDAIQAGVVDADKIADRLTAECDARTDALELFECNVICQSLNSVVVHGLVTFQAVVEGSTENIHIAFTPKSESSVSGAIIGIITFEQATGEFVIMASLGDYGVIYDRQPDMEKARQLIRDWVGSL